MNFPGRTIVTGGSTGIGEAICSRLSAEGVEVVNFDIRAPQAPLPGVTFRQVDLNDPTRTVEALREEVAAGPVLGLVNNAGVVSPNDVEHVTIEEFESVINLHLRAATLLIQGVVAGMKQAKFGRVVNMSSRSIYGREARSSYVAAKMGIVGLTRTWALELGPFGITVNAIAPGPIATALFVRNNTPEGMAKFSEKTAVGRLGTPADIAHAVHFLMQPASDFITGQTLNVCGGVSIRSYGY